MSPRRSGPTACLDEKPTSKSIRLGGRFINLSRLAEFGFDHSYLSRILAGDRNPSMDYARRVAKCLGILTDDKEPDTTQLFILIKQRRDDN